MRYLTDVRLKGSTFLIIQQTLQEAESQGSSDCQGIMSNAIRRAVENKVRKMRLELDERSAGSISVSSRSFLMEGQGSIEISKSPTEAQVSIVRSLVKVILHQITSFGSYNLLEGQENLLVSLCVEKLYIEPLAREPTVGGGDTCTAKEIANVFEASAKGGSTRETAPGASIRNRFTTNCYCCVEDYAPVETATNITEEFDKIDIQEEGKSGQDEETLIAVHPLLSGVPLSSETLAQSHISLLPSSQYEGLWESLQFDENIKQRLFSYATISLKLSQFSQQKVSQALVSSNKILLVHGPPGTGKTTVCKALCQKLAIRYQRKTRKVFQQSGYNALMIELSCSRIFSRWFGESAKNLDKIFQDIENLLNDECNNKRFICLLMDEVETLASSRSSLISKNETTDGIRVVNTLLTRLDSLKKYDNFLIMATSNLLTSLDEAFLDRADGVFYLGNPSEHGTRMILASTISELLQTGVISCQNSRNLLYTDDIQNSIGYIAQQCVLADISGRTLRKLPLVCLSEHLYSLPVTLREFMLALAMTVKQKTACAQALSQR
ncbi:LADA_0D04280g1_1 [Lachancea dasiensis]|uniref:LADA_0D04280g1_1 n=1 Tax=Lachancea dasiensis TaxID=1072105 RepID=A0A1G4J5B4_9SACH|nr:LADA_0D04280g1_1 [Lachancea dasiensis]